MQDIDLLYSDSDPAQRDHIARIVESAGFSLRVVDPPDLMHTLRDYKPRVLLAEAAILPDGSGSNARRLVICTPETLSEGIRAVKEGAHDVLLRPLDVSRVIDALEGDFPSPSRLTFRHSDDHVRVILEASPIPQLVSRVSDGTILYINDHLSVLLGLTADELLGQATPDFYFDPADREWVLSALGRDGHLFNHELRIKNKDGDMLWVLSSMVATHLDGEPVSIVGLYDITERKRVEEELREGKEIFQQLTDTIEDVFWMYDIKEDRRVFVSSGFDEAFRGMLDGKTYLDIAHPDDRERLEKQMDEAWGKPVKVENQFRVVLKDGSIRWIRSRGFPILNEEGEVHRYCGLDIDVTDRIEQEEALRESEEQFKQLTDNIDDVFWIFDIEKEEVVFVSPIFEERFGGVLGRDLEYLDIVHPDDKRRVAVIMNSEEEKTDEVWRVIRKDGEVRWIRSRAFPVRNSEGEIYRYCGLNSDITERVEHEEALRESETKIRQTLTNMEQVNRDLRDAQTRLVQSEKMASLGNLVAGVAHEINTPVGAINSMHDTLVRGVQKLKDTLGEDAGDLLASNRMIQRSLKVIDEANRVIKTGTDRVTTIVRSLRSFARLDEAEKKDALLTECIEDALTLVRHEVKGRVHVEKDFADLPPIECFPSRLNQVFLNILVNAAQAIEGEGHIRIRTSTLDDDRVRIEISDDGRGMDSEVVAKIFDPGFTTKGVGVGTGLGLSICYQIVQDHHGEITVDSKPGSGTTFTIDLPRILGENT